MTDCILNQNQTEPNLKGIIKIPGDKSISHRAVMISSLAKGKFEFNNFLMSEDCLATVEAFRKLGVKIKVDKKKKKMFGYGLLYRLRR